MSSSSATPLYQVFSAVAGVRTDLTTAQGDITTLQTDVANCYSASNPPPASNPPAVSGVVTVANASATFPATDASDGKLIIFVADTPGSGNETMTSTYFASPTDSKVVRVANGNDPASNLTDSITINDGTANVAVLLPGEIVRLQWWADAPGSGANARWLKIPGF